MPTYNQNNLKSMLAYITMCLFLSYEMALQVSPGVLAKSLLLDFHLNAATLGLLSGFFFYTYSLMQIPAGILYDHYSTRYLTLFAIFTCVLGLYLFSLPSYFWINVLGRLLIGFGSAFSFIGVLTVAAYQFEAKHFPLLSGVAQFLAGLGAFAGQEPLALLIKKYNWHGLMYLLCLLGIVLMALVIIFINNHTMHKRKKEKKEHKSNVINDLKKICSKRIHWHLAIYAFLCWSPVLILASLWGVPFITQLYTDHNAQAAQAIGMIWVGIMIGSPSFGYISSRIPSSTIPCLKWSVFIGIIVSCFIIYQTLSPLILYIMLIILGICCSAQILVFSVTKAINKTEVTSTIIGFINMAVVLPGIIFQPLIGQLLNWQWDHTYINNLPNYSTLSYQYALSVVPLCMLLAWYFAAWKIQPYFKKQGSFC
jgi:MFS family permease